MVQRISPRLLFFDFWPYFANKKNGWLRFWPSSAVGFFVAAKKIFGLI
jgi:hypothetical protein